MSEYLLIRVSGGNPSGVTATIATILAKHEAEVLDIGQAVIHEVLSLGVLVRYAPQVDSAKLVKDVLFAVQDMQSQVHFTHMSDADYREWVALQGSPRHIVTLIVRDLSAKHIAAVMAVVEAHGLVIDDVNRLSGRLPPEVIDTEPRACIEFWVKGRANDLTALRSDFLELARDLDVDIAYQEDNLFRRNRRLVCFDMDSTLIEAEVIDELAKAAGVGPQVVEITEAAMAGEIDFNESFSRRVALLKGLDESALEEIANQLVLTEGAERLISTIKRLGYRTAILSGGFNYFGRYLQERLGIDYVYANELEIVDGKVTGRVVGTVVNGEMKAELLQEIAAKENLALEQVIAVGDGANDLPMLSIAGLGVAFRAKPIVKESAKQAISTFGLDGILYLLGFSDRHTRTNLANLSP